LASILAVNLSQVGVTAFSAVPLAVPFVTLVISISQLLVIVELPDIVSLLKKAE
jgi:hypothetical protein